MGFARYGNMLKLNTFDLLLQIASTHGHMHADHAIAAV